MSTIAYGAEKVKALQYALGGKPSEGSGKRARMSLEKFVTDRFKTMKAARQEEARLSAPIRDRLISQILKDDPSVKHSIEERQRSYKRGLKRKIPQPKTMKIEPRFVTGSYAWVKAPPYDDQWSSGGNASADKASGTYKIDVASFGGGSAEAAAGIMVR